MLERLSRASQRGFSLIEAMIGLAVGMIAVLIIAQTFQMFERQKTTTTAGADAQENGLMALNIIEQDVRNAGAGIVENGSLECDTMYTYLDTGSGTPGPISGFSTAPVSISDGSGTNGSDTITIRSGADFLGAIPAYLRGTMPQPSAELDVNRTYGFQDHDLVIASQGGNCTLMEVTQVQNAALKIQHNPNATPPSYNPAANYQNTNAWPAYTTGAKLFNIGQMMIHTYSVNSALNLELADSASLGAVAVNRPLVSQIVSLQAQYGVSNAGSEVVECWVNAAAGQSCTFAQGTTPGTLTENWNAPNNAMIKRIKAVRITVVARAPRRENEIVTATAPAAEVSSLSDWQYYRYKTYETVVPIKNILWANLL